MKRYRSIMSMILTTAVLVSGCGTQAVSNSSDENAGTDESLEIQDNQASEQNNEFNTEYQGNMDDDTVQNIISYVPETISAKQFPVYFGDLNCAGEMNLYFMDDGDIPYVSLDEWTGTIEDLYAYYFGLTDSNVSMEANGSKVSISVNNSPYTMELDFDKQSIYFVDINEFLKVDENLFLLDSDYVSYEDGLMARGSGAIERYGDEVTYNLASYNINMIKAEDGYFLPLQTIADIWTARLQAAVLYNGENVMFVSDKCIYDAEEDKLTDMGELYYSAEPKNLSDEYGLFNHNELCFALDNLYGLMEVHDIESFEKLFDVTGLVEGLSGTDPYEEDKALYKLIVENLDDIHSTYLSPSYLTGFDTIFDDAPETGISNFKLDSRYEELTGIRDKYYPNGVPGYEEIGNTAFITFDNFTYATENYYEVTPDENATDTVGIILYACSQILRENSPIKNVVLDLSCNTGGEVSAAAFVIASFLSNGNVCIKDVKTGALCENVYLVDTDLDGEYTDKDKLAGKGLNIYCLTSQVSFSCGNFVPCTFKDSGEVHIMGQRSGGGACMVQPMTTAMGSMFTISGNNRMSFMKNGSFYDIDQGVEPDYYIGNVENFYDRKALSDYINSLF